MTFNDTSKEDVQQDIQVRCADCGSPFTFSVGEQNYYAERNLTAPPKRCKPCREAKKTRSREQS